MVRTCGKLCVFVWCFRKDDACDVCAFNIVNICAKACDDRRDCDVCDVWRFFVRVVVRDCAYGWIRFRGGIGIVVVGHIGR